jgi:hypothetical protein
VPVAAGACALVLLGGCVIDANRPRITYVNEASATVVVTVELPGGESTREREVPAHGAADLALPGCEDDSGLRVATVDGEVLGTVDGPLCPGDVLTITDEVTLEYDPVGQDGTGGSP